MHGKPRDPPRPQVHRVLSVHRVGGVRALRGRVRHPLLAPADRPFVADRAVQRADVRCSPRCRTGRSSTSPRSPSSQLCRQLADDPRRGARAHSPRPHPRREQVQRHRLPFALPPRLQALLREVVRRAAAVGAGAVPEDRGAGAVDSRRSTRRCSRCCRRAATSGAHRDPFAGSLRYHLGPRDAECGGLRASSSTASRTTGATAKA